MIPTTRPSATTGTPLMRCSSSSRITSRTGVARSTVNRVVLMMLRARIADIVLPGPDTSKDTDYSERRLYHAPGMGSDGPYNGSYGTDRPPPTDAPGRIFSASGASRRCVDHCRGRVRGDAAGLVEV